MCACSDLFLFAHDGDGRVRSELIVLYVGVFRCSRPSFLPDDDVPVSMRHRSPTARNAIHELSLLPMDSQSF